MSEMPAPLVAPEVDLTGFDFMPLKIARLQKSKAWLICKRRPDLAFYLLNLWMRAWEEKPAGSIEDDDDVLADAAMCDPKRWVKIRTDVLRGWIKCSDGRLYHSTVAELATEAWQERLAFRARAAAAREAKRQKREGAATASVTETETDHGKDADTEDATEHVTGLKGQGREGTGKGQGSKEGGETQSEAARLHRKNGITSLAASGGPSSGRRRGQIEFTPEERKQAWETKISAEICRRKDPAEADRVLSAYLAGEPWAKAEFEKIDRDLKGAR